VTAVLELQQSCAPAGTCVFSTDAGTSTFCYGNGTRGYLMQTSTLTTIRETTSGGADCYTELITTPPDGGLSMATGYVFKDGTGATIATATVDAQRNLTFMCGGQTWPPAGCRTDGGSGGTSGNSGTGGGLSGPCTPGACP
jgi:hypothetical protein